MASVVEMFLDALSAEKGFSANALQAYESDITQFLDITQATPENINSEHISNFLQTLTRQAYAPKTVNRKLSAVRTFCKFLLEEQFLKQNPFSYISAPKTQKPLPHFFTKEQVDTLYQTAQNHNNPAFQRVATIIRLMFATGLRVSEALKLTLGDINFKNRQIYIKGKGSKDRIVFFDEQTQSILQSYLSAVRPEFQAKNKPSVFFFPSLTATDGHLTRDAFFKALKKLALQCNIPINITSPHTLRHSFATNLINHDADLRSVQKMLGHENITTTEIYTHITQKRIIDSVFLKHPLQHLKEQEYHEN
ncbi:MAG: tyrosine recombinase [Alphaproteobacteria bacterium]|nr:tyrosine recombinase [Alphaproteobacteria bacterium]